MVLREIDSFDADESTTRDEEALRRLWAHFPGNHELTSVLLKTICLNHLYSAHVRGKDIALLARHIVDLDVDPLLAVGAPEVVGRTTTCQNLRCYYSFATKYCNWHNPDKYPIHDGHVDAALWYYKRHDGFVQFHRQDLYNYSELIRIIDAFKKHYGLEQLNYKQVDKFLWNMGELLLSNQESIVSATTTDSVPSQPRDASLTHHNSFNPN